MPWNGFSLGHDISIDITDPTTGKLLSFPPVTGFSAEPIYSSISSHPLNDAPVFTEIPAGWHGTLDFDRKDAAIDAFFAKMEALYYSGVNTLNGTITQTVNEQSTGAISQFQYPQVAIKLSQAGHWTANGKVAQQVSWSSGRRKQVV